MTEQEFSGVLTLGNFVDDGLNQSAFYHPIQRNAGHDRWGCPLHEWVKNDQQNDRGLVAARITGQIIRTPVTINWDNHGTYLRPNSGPTSGHALIRTYQSFSAKEVMTIKSSC